MKLFSIRIDDPEVMAYFVFSECNYTRIASCGFGFSLLLWKITTALDLQAKVELKLSSSIALARNRRCEAF
jgi:hypothetical protein